MTKLTKKQRIEAYEYALDEVLGITNNGNDCSMCFNLRDKCKGWHFRQVVLYFPEFGLFAPENYADLRVNFWPNEFDGLQTNAEFNPYRETILMLCIEIAKSSKD
jgi:hypothetical protein